MTAKSFIQEYAQQNEGIAGIPGLTMNAPFTEIIKKGDVGIEIEVEGRRLPVGGNLEALVAPDSKAKWVAKTDGSLRNGGIEYVLSTPCYVAEVKHLLEALWDVFRKLDSGFNLSNRCSTHVHVNQTGRKVNQLTSIIALWSAFEEVLINWCGEERKTNHFCLSNKDSTSLLEAWNWGLKQGSLHRHLGDGFKYLSLNIRPIYTFGSFEFRTMRASETWEPIWNWTMFLYGLCQYSDKHYPNPQFLANDMSERGGRQIFLDMCAASGVLDSFADEVFNHSENVDFDSMALSGFRRAQPIVMGYPWYDWMELIDKTYIPSPFAKKKKNLADPLNDLIRFRDLDGELIRPIRPFVQERPPEADVPVLPRYFIDWTQPVEFVNGVPARVHQRTFERANAGEEQGSGMVMASERFESEGHRLDREWYSYDTNTGWWSGSPRIAQIRNIGAEPRHEGEIDGPALPAGWRNWAPEEDEDNA